MLIGELIKRSGLTRDTIRFYEKRGLIKLSRNDRRDNNYKEYSEEVLERLELIKVIKSFGFTINEIQSFFELWEFEDPTCDTLYIDMERKISDVDAHIQRLLTLKAKLIGSLDRCKGGSCDFEKQIPSCVRS